jgi:hypothetical protein
MSTSEPFLPSGEARPEGDPRDREIDSDVDADVNEEAGVHDPAADTAADTAADASPAAASGGSAPSDPVFRTPQPGERLSPEALEEELGDSTS